MADMKFPDGYITKQINAKKSQLNLGLGVRPPKRKDWKAMIARIVVCTARGDWILTIDGFIFKNDDGYSFVFPRKDTGGTNNGDSFPCGYAGDIIKDFVNHCSDIIEEADSRAGTLTKKAPAKKRPTKKYPPKRNSRDEEEENDDDIVDDDEEEDEGDDDLYDL